MISSSSESSLQLDKAVSMTINAMQYSGMRNNSFLPAFTGLVNIFFIFFYFDLTPDYLM